MKFNLFVIATFIAASDAIRLDGISLTGSSQNGDIILSTLDGKDKGIETGAPIPICNGENAGACSEPIEVNTHRIRRPFKRAAPGDPDFAAQEAADKAAVPHLKSQGFTQVESVEIVAKKSEEKK